MPIPEVLVQAAQAWPTIWLLDLLRYLLAVAAVLAVLDLVPARWSERRIVRIREVAAGQRLREFLRSLRTIVVFSLVGASVFVGHRTGISRIYEDPAEHGWPWLFASLALVIILHDAWFYWTHRLIHCRALFGPLHRTHHLSVAPTPWTAYAFSAGEALVQALFLPLVLLVVPVHPGVLFAWMVWMVVRNVMGHAGAELLPRRWLAGWWGRWMTTSLHHEMHHACGRGNYGLYFTWWDRWCGTEHPEYQARLATLVARMASAPGASAADRPASIHSNSFENGMGRRAEDS